MQFKKTLQLYLWDTSLLWRQRPNHMYYFSLATFFSVLDSIFYDLWCLSHSPEMLSFSKKYKYIIFMEKRWMILNIE